MLFKSFNRVARHEAMETKHHSNRAVLADLHRCADIEEIVRKKDNAVKCSLRRTALL